MKTDPVVADAAVHLRKVLLDLASAVEVKWAQTAYLRLRFRASLDTFLPPANAWATFSPDRDASGALASLKRLQSLWATKPSGWLSVN